MIPVSAHLFPVLHRINLFIDTTESFLQVKKNLLSSVQLSCLQNIKNITVIFFSKSLLICFVFVITVTVGFCINPTTCFKPIDYE